jgi:hypothetical protein
MIAARLRRPTFSSSAAMASAFSVVRGAANTGSYSAAAGASNGPDSSQFTLTALSRWSILNKQLPPVDKIRALHIYDFDNTRTTFPSPWSSEHDADMARFALQCSRRPHRTLPSGSARR